MTIVNRVVATRRVEITAPEPHEHVTAVKLASGEIVEADDLLVRLDAGEEFHMLSAVKGLVYWLGAVACPTCGERVPWA